MRAKRDADIGEDYQTNLNMCCMINSPRTITRRFRYKRTHRDYGKKFMEVTLSSDESFRKGDKSAGGSLIKI